MDELRLALLFFAGLIFVITMPLWLDGFIELVEKIKKGKGGE
jgi:hypothetical protein